MTKDELAKYAAQVERMQADSYAEMEREQVEAQAFIDDLREKIEARVFALLLSTPKLKNNDEGRAAFRDAVLEVLPEGTLVESAVEVTREGDIVVRWSRPIDHVVLEPVTASNITPACVPTNPCGCYGCPVCNGSQGPLYLTPPYGSPSAGPCSCGSSTCNKCRAARGMGPAGVTPPLGRAKPNGGGSPKTRAANAERGYRVLPYGDWLNAYDDEQRKLGVSFSTPDLATRCARKGAKEGKETFLVLRDGARWKLLKADGDEVVIG